MPAAVHDELGELVEARPARLPGQPELDEVEHRELVQVLAALAVAAKARADLEDPEGPAPDAAELAQERVEVRGQHGPQAGSVLEPEDLLAQRVAVPDAHLRQRLAGDDVRRHDLDEARVDEGGAQRRLELEQSGRAPGPAQLVELRPAGAHEVLLELLEGGVARRRRREVLVQLRRIGAELAQALDLRRRQPHHVGRVGAHTASSPSERRPLQVRGQPGAIAAATRSSKSALAAQPRPPGCSGTPVRRAAPIARGSRRMP